MTQNHFTGRWNMVSIFWCFWVPFLLLLALILCLFSPRVHLMGCRKHWAPELTVCIMCPSLRFPITFPVPLSPANYRVNIPIRPGRHIRRIRQLLSAPLIVTVDKMLNFNLVLTLSLTLLLTHKHTQAYRHRHLCFSISSFRRSACLTLPSTSRVHNTLTN